MPICPICGSSEYIPIIYGCYPSKELTEKAEKGEVILEDCDEISDKNIFRCKECGNDYK